MAVASRSTRLRCLLAAVSLAAGLPLAGCLGVPEGAQPVEDFSLERYLGTWYEIARLDHSFERGLTHVTAHYSQREDGGVRVVNRGFDAEEGRWEEAVGRAYFAGDPGVGRLKVSFFGPFYGAYNVIALDHENYSWSLVAGPDHGYLWILSRDPDLDPKVYEALVARAREAGFDVDALIRVPHGP